MDKNDYDEKNNYDPIGGHTKEEAEAAYEKLFRELHGEKYSEESDNGKASGDNSNIEKIVVVGHREPDTDSICSAIAYARLKNEVDPSREYIPYRAGNISDETAFVLKYFDTPEPYLFIKAENILETEAIYKSNSGRSTVSKRNIILVDHNDPACSAEGISEEMILEIIDHHSLAPADTTEPIVVRIQPCGSAAAIIYEIYREKGIIPDRETAGLLCAAVISDTHLFKAAGTTSLDRLSGAALANIAGLDIEAFFSCFPR